ncbi:Rv1733c family protein [Streptomyces guryensis]|uniref:Integral membrane protein n=1 Tax=Streptomyces guryensis TaxID=2886947 RepID=A0A9Q3VV40_9ACTN|nr:hypothetical protein [Streptomyces guryensis]MCD9879144.1 hypothetical protein [Streptomyces guryensis]
MARTCRSSVWMWRWRRNALRRRSDVFEAWLLLAVWILAAAGSLFTALAVAGSVEHNLNQQRLERHAVAAVLTEKAAGRTSAAAVDDEHVWATARWTAPDGSPRTGQTKVAPDSAKGTPVMVWTDRRGRLTPKPAGPGDARFRGVWAGTMTGIGVGTAVIGAGLAGRGLLERRRLREWAEEWQRVDTRWGHTTG